MKRLTEKDEQGNKLVLKNSVEELRHWSISTSPTGTQTIRGYAVDKLSEYEYKEEQGLLRQLPCSIGSDVYFIPSKSNFRLNKRFGPEKNNRVYHQKVKRITFTERGWHMECDKDLEYGTGKVLVDIYYKKHGSCRKPKLRKHWGEWRMVINWPE